MTAPFDTRRPLDPAFKAEALAVAARLERYAAEIRNRAERVVDTNLHDGYPEHADAAANIIKTVQTLMGNLNLDDLTRAASRADRKAMGHGEATDS